MQKVKAQDEKYNRLMSSAVNMLENQGFEKIKADLEDYERPSTLSQRNGDVSYTPDITAFRREGKCYFEIVTKDKKNRDEEVVVGKWKLLSTLAQMRNGSFFLLVPRGTMRFATQTLAKYNIDADILKLQAN